MNTVTAPHQQSTAMLQCLGLSHHETPLTIREQLSLSPQAQTEFLQSLIALPSVSEAIVISTCNRVEIHIVSVQAVSLTEIEHLLPCDVDLEPYCFHYSGSDASWSMLSTRGALDHIHHKRST